MLFSYHSGEQPKDLRLESMQFGFPCYEDHLASHLNDRLEGQDWRLGKQLRGNFHNEIGENGLNKVVSMAMEAGEGTDSGGVKMVIFYRNWLLI